MKRVGNFWVLLFLAVLVLSNISSQGADELMILGQSPYLVNDTVTIEILSDITLLRIISPEKTYAYQSPPRSIKFIPREPGIHLVELFHEGTYLASQYFQVEAPISQEKTPQLSMAKKDYLYGEEVVISIENAEVLVDYELELNAEGRIYKFFNLASGDIRFFPAFSGKHELKLVKYGEIVSETSFYVVQPVSNDTSLLKGPHLAEKTNQEDMPFLLESLLQGSSQGEARLGEKVKWTKSISLNELSQIDETKLPSDITGLVIYHDKDILYRAESEINVKAISKANTLSAQDTVNLEFYTAGPVSEEKKTRRGKIVNVKSNIHYANVTVFTELDEILNVRDVSIVRVWWEQEGKYLPAYFKDRNGNGIYDYVEWIAPHLSSQTFEIIVITKAEHLDREREFISDIYAEVRGKDNIWSPEIHDGEYVRVRFEKSLTAEKDITVFPMVLSGSPYIEVFLAGTDQKIAQFPYLRSGTYNKVFLAGMEGSHSEFDLKVKGGNIAFDHIIDPPDFLFNVQRGSVSMTTTSLSVSISPVNTSKAFVIISTMASSSLPSVLHVTGTLVNSTTLRLDKFSTTATVVEWQVIEGPNLLVQRGEETTPLTTTASITARWGTPVDMDKSFILVNGRINSGTAGHNVRDFWTGEFVNGTEMILSRGVTGTVATASWQVVQWEGASVQRGTAAATNTPNTVALSNSVDLSKSFIISSSRSSARNGIDTMAKAFFINETHVALQRLGTTGTTLVSFFVVSSDQVSVQSGSYTFTATGQQSIPLSYVNNASTFTFSRNDYSGADRTYKRAFVAYWLHNQTMFRMEKKTATNTVNTSWFVVEFVGTDTIPPNVTILSPINKYYGPNDFPVIVNVSLSEDGSSVLYTLDSWGTNSTMSSLDNRNYNATIVSLADGEYTFVVFANDTSGNINDTVSIVFNVDRTGPQITIYQPKPQYYFSGENMLLNFSVLDTGIGNLSSCWWNLNNTANNTLACNQTLLFNASEGSHTLYLYANDTLGNIGYADVFFSVSSGEPVVTLKYPLDASWITSKSQVNFSYTAEDEVGIDTCTLYGDWNGWHANASNSVIANGGLNNFSVDMSSVPDGEYVWNVLCNDTTGLKVFALANFTFSIDTLAPELHFTGYTEPDSSEFERDWIYAEVNLTEANFQNITFRLFLEGALLNEQSFSYQQLSVNWTGLANNNRTYYYNVTSYDIAGQNGRTETRMLKLIDITPPSLNVVDPVSRTYNSLNVPLNFSVFDANLDMCWYELNLGAPVILQDCENTTLLAAEGDNVFTLYINDTLGQVSSYSTGFRALQDVIVQRGVESMTTTSLDVAISPVNTSKAFVLLSTRASRNLPNVLHVTGTLVNSTTLRLQKFSTVNTIVQWEVVEGSRFFVQRGENTTPGRGITAMFASLPVQVNPKKSFGIVYGRINSGTAANNARDFWVIELSSSGTINLNRSSTGTSATASWQVVEWGGSKVQSGVALASGTPTIVHLGEPVQLDRSFIISSFMSSGTNGIDTLGRVYFINETSIGIQRLGATGTTAVSYYVISTDQANVQSENYAFLENNPQNRIINSVNTGKTFTFSRNDYSAADTTYQRAFVTTKLASDTLVQLEKSGAVATVNASWFAVELVQDDQLPGLSISLPISKTYKASEFPIQINITLSEEGSLALFSYNGWASNFSMETSDNFIYNSSIQSLPDGNYTLSFYAEDTWGNSNTSEYVVFTVDTTGPNLTIISPGSNISSSATIQLNISAKDVSGVSRLWYNWNGTNYTYTSPVNITFSEGQNTIHVWANDTLNNPSYLNFTFIVDTFPPVVNIVSPQEQAYNTTEITLNISASDPNLDSIWYSLGGPSYPYIQEINLTFPEGNSTLIAFANDSVGNIGSLNITFLVDVSGPITEVTSPVNFSEINSESYLLQANSSDLYSTVSTVTFLYRNDSLSEWNLACIVSVFPFQCNWNTSGLSERNSYEIRAFANDSLGNIGGNFTVYNVTVDNKPPKVSDIAPAFGSEFNLTSPLQINAQITDGLGVSAVFANITKPDGSNLTVGLQHISGAIYGANFSDYEQRGTYNVRFYAFDMLGNLNSTESTNFQRIAPHGKVVDIIENSSYAQYSVSILDNSSGVLVLQINLTGHKVQSIALHAHNEQSTGSIIRIANHTNDEDFIEGFMLDLSSINMSYANITSNASGYHLMKCTDFEQDSLTCNEDYETVLSGLAKGELYTFTMNSSDPLFGETIQGPANISDSYIRGAAANSNFGGSTLIRIGKSTANNPLHGLIWFNLSSLPEGIKVNSANLSLYFFAIVSGDATGDRTHNIYRVQQSPPRPWTETGVTWNRYNATNLWTTPGGDYQVQPTDSQTFNNSRINTFIVYNVTSDVQAFLDDPSLNFGWIIRDSDESTLNTRRDYRSKEHTTAAERPKLDIMYEDITPPGVLLDSPENNSFTNLNNLTFFYNVSDNIGFGNCTLYIEGALNQTNTTIFNNQRNNFTLYNVGDGIYDWSISCMDSSGLSNSTGTREVYVDTENPKINLIEPYLSQTVGASFNFSFSVLDNLAGSMNCSLFINGIQNETDILAINNTPITLPKSFGTEDTYSWNITCTDSALNTNTSETWYFTVSIAPPVISAVQAIPNYTGLGQRIMIRADVSDLDGISYVIANITKPSGNEIVAIYNASGITYEGYFNSTWFNSVYNFTIVAGDSLGNFNTSGKYNFSINTSTLLSIITEKDSYGPNQIVNINSTSPPWWNTSWNYRLPVVVNSNASKRTDYPVEFAINLTHELRLMGGNGMIDNNSIRVVEWDGIQNREVKSQYDNVTDFGIDWSESAYLEITWIMNGTTEYSQERYYYIYFDTAENPKPAPDYNDGSFNFTFNAASTVINNRYLSIILDDSGVIEDIRSKDGSMVDVTENWYWNYLRVTNAWSVQGFTGTIVYRRCGPVKCTVINTIPGWSNVATANTTYHVYADSREIRSFKGIRMSTTNGMQIGDDLNVNGGYTFQATGSHPVNWIQTTVMDGAGTNERADRPGGGSTVYDYDTGFWAYRVTGGQQDAYAVVRKYVKNESGKGTSLPMHVNWWDSSEHAAGWENGFGGGNQFIAGQDYQIANYYYVTTADDSDYQYALEFYNSTVNDPIIIQDDGEELLSTFSGMLNRGNTNLSGYLFMAVDSNITGEWNLNYTVLNDNLSGKLRNFSSASFFYLSQIWNGPGEGSGWNTGNTASGYYRARVELRDDEGNVLMDSAGNYLNSTYVFYVDISPPVWYILNVSNSTPTPNTLVYFSANWTENFGLASWQFFWSIDNAPFSIQDSGTFGGTYNWSTASKTIPLSAEGKTIRFYFRAFDVQGAFADTNLSNITILDVTSPQIFSESASPLKSYRNETVNISAVITDNIQVDRAWANITLPGGSSQIAYMNNDSSLYYVLFSNTSENGRYNVTIVANDTYNNLGSSSSFYFDVYGLSNVSYIYPKGGTYPIYTLIELACLVSDYNTSQPVENYMVEFYAGGILLGSNRTNSSGIAVRLWNITGIGDTQLNCTIQNSPSLYYDAHFYNSNSSLFVLTPNLTLERIDHNNNVSYGLEEYETYDIIWSINITSKNIGGANASSATTKLSVITGSIQALWFNEQENNCGQVNVNQSCTTQFNNSEQGYNITDLSSSGIHFWNVTLNWSGGGIPPAIFQREFLVYHVQDNVTGDIEKSEITPGESTRYLLNITNPWSKNLTGFNATINCPPVAGLSCTCYDQVGQTCVLGNMPNRTKVQGVFNITTTGSIPIGDYGINITIEYVNPGQVVHSWSEIENILLKVKPLVAFVYESPKNITRGDIFELKGYSTNIGAGSINDVTLNWTLPIGWVNISGALNMYTSVLAPSEKFWNNITINTSLSVSLGPNQIRLETYSPDANYDEDTETIFVYSRTNISNISVSDQNPYRGDTILIMARLEWDNSSSIVNQSLIFQGSIVNRTNSSGWGVVSYTIPAFAPLGENSFMINVSYPGNSTIYTLNSSAFVFISVRDRINISAEAEPRITGYGQQVSILANITSGILIDKAEANVTLPYFTPEVLALYNQSGILYSGLFNNTWSRGQYNFTVWANNTGGFENQSYESSFEVRANVTLNYTTVKSLYGANEIVNLTGTLISDWDNGLYLNRYNFNLTEPQGLARQNEHVRLNFSIEPGKLPTSMENTTSLYCEGIRLPWDAYAIAESGGYITELQGIGAVNFSSGESKVCYVYYGGAFYEEILPAYTGAAYVCNNEFSGTCGLSGNVTPVNYDYYSIYSALSLPGITCGGDVDTFYHNLYCYFKAPRTATITFATASDDGSSLYIDRNLVVNNQFCQPTTCRSGTYAVTKDRYYEMWIGYDENTGLNDLYVLYDPVTCGSGAPSGNIIDTECHPFLGGDWAILVSPGESEEVIYQGWMYNTGSTNISGFLRMNVDRNDSGNWVFVSSVINDTLSGKKRNITTGSYLNLSSIWNGPGEGSGFNTLLRETAQYRVSVSLFSPHGELLTNDDNSNISHYSYFWIDTSAPFVQLTSPFNNTWSKLTGITFSYIPNDTSLQNCSLWGNWSAFGWHLNETNTSPANEQVNTFGPKNLNEGRYAWGVECYDSLSNSRFSDTYYLNIDTTPPSITLGYPENYGNISSGEVNFTFTATDNLGLELNCTLFVNSQGVADNLLAYSEEISSHLYYLSEPGLYNWTVNCSDIAGNSMKAVENNFTVISGPSIVTINISSDNSSVILNWTASLFADSYSIFITANYSQGFGSEPNATGIKDLNWTDSNAFLSERRYYKVAAVKGEAIALSPLTVGKHTRQLFQRWNLISIPFNLTNWLLYNGSNNGRDLFTQPAECIISLWRYNPSSQSYERTDYIDREWVPAIGSDSFTGLEYNMGYWAEVNFTCNLTLFGIVPTENKTIALEQNWNIVGHHSAKDPLLYDESIMNPVVVSPPGAVQAILRYNTTIDRFEVTVYYPGWGWFPSFNNRDFIYLNPMLGYYFDSSINANWSQNPNVG